MTGGASRAAAAVDRSADAADDAVPVSAPLPAVPRSPRPAGIRAVPSPPAPPPAAPPARPSSPPSSPPADPPSSPAARAATAAPEPAPAGRRRRSGPGKRELKRLETRARIVDGAAELFAERGFDAVSVVEIAARAGVVEKTVFNHFPVKEGLVFEADPPVREALLDAVRRRPAGQPVAAAAGGFVVAAMTGLGRPEAADGVAAMARVVRGSRTLQVREREILGELTAALAALVAEETGAQPGALEPVLAAHAVLGLYAALLELARDRVLAGGTGPELARELGDRGREGLALLLSGLGGYATRC